MNSALICWCHLEGSDNGVRENSSLVYSQYYIIKKERILETPCLQVFRHIRGESLQEMGQMATAILSLDQ